MKNSRKCARLFRVLKPLVAEADRKSTRLNSSHVSISYAVFCLKKKTYTIFYITPLAIYFFFSIAHSATPQTYSLSYTTLFRSLEEWFARHPLDLDPRVPPSREW